LVLVCEIQETNNQENFYNDGPYQACVRGFFLAYHQVVAYHLWLLFRPTDLERYCEFEVSLEWVMFIVLLLVFFLSNGQRFLALVHASGKSEQGSGPPVDRWSHGRAHQE
jgi:hypothetical protein